MATSLVQIRVEHSLKEQASALYERLGIDLSTAVRMFLKRSVLVNGIPFSMTLPKADDRADRAFRAMQAISDASERNGLSEMSLDEINAEIHAARKEMERMQ